MSQTFQSSPAQDAYCVESLTKTDQPSESGTISKREQPATVLNHLQVRPERLPAPSPPCHATLIFADDRTVFFGEQRKRLRAEPIGHASNFDFAWSLVPAAGERVPRAGPYARICATCFIFLQPEGACALLSSPKALCLHYSLLWQTSRGFGRARA